MKLLIYALQSSGASAFTYLISQKKDVISIIDLYSEELAPFISHPKYDIVLKCTVSKDHSLLNHIDSFKPDKVILFTRDMSQVIASLETKKHANKGGSISEKIEIFNKELHGNLYDFTFSYNDMLSQKIGCLDFFIDKSSYESSRTVEEIIDFSNQNCAWCKENYKKKWQIGCLAPRVGLVEIESKSRLVKI